MEIYPSFKAVCLLVVVSAATVVWPQGGLILLAVAFGARDG